jgi:hypothetical protein
VICSSVNSTRGCVFCGGFCDRVKRVLRRWAGGGVGAGGAYDWLSSSLACEMRGFLPRLFFGLLNSSSLNFPVPSLDFSCFSCAKPRCFVPRGQSSSSSSSSFWGGARLVFQPLKTAEGHLTSLSTRLRAFSRPLRVVRPVPC